MKFKTKNFKRHKKAVKISSHISSFVNNIMRIDGQKKKIQQITFYNNSDVYDSDLSEITFSFKFKKLFKK